MTLTGACKKIIEIIKEASKKEEEVLKSLPHPENDNEDDWYNMGRAMGIAEGRVDALEEVKDLLFEIKSTVSNNTNDEHFKYFLEEYKKFEDELVFGGGKDQTFAQYMEENFDAIKTAEELGYKKAKKEFDEKLKEMDKEKIHQVRTILTDLANSVDEDFIKDLKTKQYLKDMRGKVE